MEFKIKKKGARDLGKYDPAAMKIAREFTKRLYDELGTFLKTVVLFGSSAREKSKGDIDVLVVIDDVSMEMNAEIAETYRIIVEKIISDVSTKLHITTLKLTSFWEYVRAGDPVGINILRDGIAMLDTGMFDPLKQMLKEGRIRPTEESMWAYFMKAPSSIASSRSLVMRACVDLYWAVMDSSHAALMSMGEVPPSPENVPDLIREKLVSKRLVPANYPSVVKKYYDMMKGIEHGNIKEIKGTTYDSLMKEASEFVLTMRKIVDRK